MKINGNRSAILSVSMFVTLSVSLYVYRLPTYSICCLSFYLIVCPFLEYGFLLFGTISMIAFSSNINDCGEDPVPISMGRSCLRLPVWASGLDCLFGTYWTHFFLNFFPSVPWSDSMPFCPFVHFVLFLWSRPIILLLFLVPWKPFLNLIMHLFCYSVVRIFFFLH